MKKMILPLCSISILLVCWQLLASITNRPELIPSVPRLFVTLHELITTTGFYHSLIATIGRGMLGMFISLIAAVLLAILFVRHKLIYELFRPLLSLMRSVPVISFILLALIFLQPESIPLIIAMLTMLPLLCENLTKGLQNLNPGLRNMAKTFRISRTNYYLQIIYPQLNPFLFSGLTSALGFGWRAIIMGEVLAQCTLGIGGEMKKAQTFIDVPTLMSWTIIAITISFIFDKGIDLIGKIHFPIFTTPNSIHEQKNVNYKSASTIQHEPIISLINVHKSYGDKAILKNISFTFKQGKIYGISAPSGTGKSTLLHLINGSLQPSSGRIITPNKNKGIACVFQEPELVKHLSVLDNVILPLASYYSFTEAKTIALKFLEMMEINDLTARYPNELSYGQQQRVAIARAQAYPSSLLLMDEPFKGLDNELTERIALRLRELQYNSAQTIIFVTHKPEELTLLANETIKLY